MKVCPTCGIQHSDETIICDCGYNFMQTKINKEEDAIPFSNASTETIASQKEVVHLRAGWAFIIFLGYFGGQIVGALLVGIIGGIIAALNGLDIQTPEAKAQFTQTIMAPAAIIAAITGAIIMIVLAFSLVRNQLRDGSPTGAAWILGTPGKWGIGLLIGILVAFIGLLFPLWLLPSTEDIQVGPLSKMAMTPGISQLVWLSLALILGPPVEELLFRGILFGGFRRSFGPIWGGIGMTILFLLLHITEVIHYWPALIGLGLLAVTTLWIRLRAGAVGPAIALHFSYNLVIAAIITISTRYSG